MKISELFNNKKAVYSFELFPPKTTDGVEKLYTTLEELKGLSPDYVSVTYGAGGTASSKTLELAKLIKSQYGIEPLPHITCINSTREQVELRLREFAENGFESVLALRGDKVAGYTQTDFVYATDLVRFIKERYPEVNVSAACYPEGHPESENMLSDVRHLKEKVEAGASHLNSQLFFDNEDFFRFRDNLALAGITVPVAAGIMPLVKSTQIDRIVSMTGCKIPSKISRMIARFADKPDALMEAGVAYATDQIIDLLSAGVSGIHLYVMNNSYVAKKITENITSVLENINK